MKKKFNLLSTIIAALIFISCNNKNVTHHSIITDREKTLCDSLNIDTSIVLDIRHHNSNKIERFHYSLSKMYKDGVETELEPIYLPGLVFSEQNSKSYDLIFNLKDSFRKKGYSIFLLENNFNIGNALDHIAILKTTDKYAVLKQVETNGINYDITNDSLLKIVKNFDEKYSLELIGASGDWCDFYITSEPQDWNEFAREVYKVCPDVVEQGTGTVEALAAEMKETKRLYFWWD